jgi:O-antigen biosynthesis protein
VILSGRRLVYEPSALAWHDHPGELASLRRTMFRYGAGLSGLMAKWCLEDRAVARAVARRVPSAARLVLDGRSRKNAGKRPGYPRSLTALELAGMVSGPVLFARAAWRERGAGAG